MFPNVTVTRVTNETVTFKIEYGNWWKYQGDFSGDRVKRHRAKIRESVTAKKRGEEKRREEKRGEQINTSNPIGFDSFWAHYFPKRRVAKQGAMKAWKVLNPTKELQAEILSALSKQSDRYSLVEDSKIPHAATWLNGRRWEDEIPTNGTGKAMAPDPYAGQSTAWKCQKCGGVHESKPRDTRTCPQASLTV
jgi:hypothetical protein